MKRKIRGVVVPILTPLTPDQQVDVPSLRRLVRHVIDGGVHGIWAAGTTGEFAALEPDQRRLVIDTVADEAGGRVAVIGNVSAPATKATLAAAALHRDSPLDGVAATPPYYYVHSQRELLDHYRAVREHCAQPLWVYNIPSTVKLTVEPTTIADLAAEGTVVGVKDSSGGGESFGQLVTACRDRSIDMYRFVGTVFRITMTASIGAHGVIPGIANLAPRSVVGAWEAGEAGDAATAAEHHQQVMSATRVMRLARDGGMQAASFSGLKSALKLMGIIEHDTVSAPLRPLDDEEKAQIPALLQELSLLD